MTLSLVFQTIRPNCGHLLKKSRGNGLSLYCSATLTCIERIKWATSVIASYVQNLFVLRQVKLTQSKETFIIPSFQRYGNAIQSADWLKTQLLVVEHCIHMDWLFSSWIEFCFAADYQYSLQPLAPLRAEHHKINFKPVGNASIAACFCHPKIKQEAGLSWLVLLFLDECEPDAVCVSFEDYLILLNLCSESSSRQTSFDFRHFCKAPTRQSYIHTHLTLWLASCVEVRKERRTTL